MKFIDVYNFVSPLSFQRKKKTKNALERRESISKSHNSFCQKSQIHNDNVFAQSVPRDFKAIKAMAMGIKNNSN